MSIKESELIDIGQAYVLGDYTFNLQISGDAPSTVTAVCSKTGGGSASKSIQIPSREAIKGWFVDANDTTADVYVYVDMLPVRIEIITLPTKLEYEDGETINISGMVVVAKNADGSTWTSSKYPNGHIPLQELVIDPTEADISKAESGGVTSDIIEGSYPVQSLYLADITIHSTASGLTGSGFEATVGKCAAFRSGNTGITIIIANKINSIKHRQRWTRYAGGSITEEYWSDEYSDSTSNVTFDNKKVYYKFWTRDSGTATRYDYDWHVDNFPYLTGSDTILKIAWSLIYGEITEGGQPITVSWARPEDGEILDDTFKITVVNSTQGN